MKIFKVLEETFLFAGLQSDEISKLLKAKEIKTERYSRGEIIYSCDDSEKKVGFIISGCCEVRKRKASSNDALLNTLSVSDSFGILSVFSNEKFPTQIYSSKNCEVLYFTKAEIEQYVNSSLQISQNLINFLTDRINFLNDKISILSSTRVEERLTQYLLFEARKSNSNSFYFNITKTSEAINAGRASVYRALDVLQKDGLISLQDKQITLCDKILKGNI